MKGLGALLLILVVSGFGFAANQTSSTDNGQFRGEIEKIDLTAKTITLSIKPAATESATQTGTMVTEAQNQTSTATKDQLKLFKFNDKTTIAALEAEEAPTTTKISDLEKGDEIVVHVDSDGLIQKIEIVAGD